MTTVLCAFISALKSLLASTSNSSCTFRLDEYVRSGGAFEALSRPKRSKVTTTWLVCRKCVVISGSSSNSR